MTAVMTRPTTIDTAAVDEFLRDPLGFGDFDFADPISLADFSTTHHFHGHYEAPLG